jgi:hypothetical protein
MTNHIFVLSYCGAQDFFNSIRVEDFPGSIFYFIDNGQQTYTPTFECYTYATSKNIGCAGGWNLICDIAFKHFNLEKIIITQDDAYYTESQIEDALVETDENCLTGVIQPHFEFSCFAIHRETYNKVGRFDENFIYVYSEDADYKQRCLKANVVVNSLMVPVENSNKSLTLKKNPELNRIQYNRDYLYFKWGKSIHPSLAAQQDMQPPFEYSTPFQHAGLFPLDYIPISNRLQKVYYPESNSLDTLCLPSVTEYVNFKLQKG